MKVKRKIIEIDQDRCDGCGQCVPSCAEGAIEIVDGKARLVAEKYCDGLGACLGECPNDALRIIEREAEDFDEKAVEGHLKKEQEAPVQSSMACGCPSTRIQSFDSIAGAKGTSQQGRAASALRHWPVQIRLVPPNAPFLKGADLLVAADCVPVAYPNFHADFLQGKVVMVGCPKFDDSEAYVQKFAEIFASSGVKSITVAVMEVPCCQGLPMIVAKGLERAGKAIPVEKVVIGPRGQIIERAPLAA